MLSYVCNQACSIRIEGQGGSGGCLTPPPTFFTANFFIFLKITYEKIRIMMIPPPLEQTRNRREINKSNTKIYVLGTKIRIPAHHGLLGFSRFGNEFFF